MISQFLIKLMTPLTQNRAMFIVWIVFVGFFLWLGELDSELKAMGGGNGVLDLQFAFTPERASAIISQWGSAGRSLALTGIFYDCFYPVSYGLVLMTLILRGMGSEHKQSTRLLWLPVVAVILDYAENLIHYRVLGSYSEMTSLSWIPLASGFATVKWALIAITVLIVLVTLIQGWRLSLKSVQRG